MKLYHVDICAIKDNFFAATIREGVNLEESKLSRTCLQTGGGGGRFFIIIYLKRIRLMSKFKHKNLFFLWQNCDLLKSYV